jgi:hypothetical protein
MERRLRESTRNGGLLWSWWARLLILGLAVSAVSVFIVTPSLIRPLAACLQRSSALGPLLFVAETDPGTQGGGKVAFALVSILILLPIVRFRLGTVIASICGVLAWKLLGEVAFGIPA